MQIRRIQIADFGKLHDMELDFSEGFQTITGENGWGKSTMAAFIKAMLYGMEATTRRSLLENERRHYQPWQGGAYGGSMEFTAGGKTYRAERTFGSKEKDDTFALYDLSTGLLSTDYSERLGEELFHIDRGAWERSCYLGQRKLEVLVNDSLHARLSHAEEDAGDIENYERAAASLEERMKFLKKTGNRGEIAKLQEERRQVREQMEAYEIQQELIRKYPQLNLVVLIASVRNTERIDAIFEKYRPNIVYHAAAHKHVPLMEVSPNEAIKNNVFGTYRTAQAADKYGVEKFVLISTDKAVNPTNVMGASKRMCEMVIQMMNRQSKTNFVAVRFGNVLGSNGSVIPLFKKQIAEGGPVTVTDPNIIRYFMTIPEAVSLVLQAGAYARGGEIFVLDMGEPVKIVDLATNLIKLSGYKPGEDIEIKFTGLRPGEKMYEELLMSEEGLKKTANKMIYIGKPIEFDDDVFKKQLDKIYKDAYDETDNIREDIKEIVPTYQGVK